MIKIAVIGYGRMGKEIVKEAVAEGLKVVAVVDAPGSQLKGKEAGSLAGTEPLGVMVSTSDELANTLDKAKPDVVIDFSSASACAKNAKTVAEKKINLVIGTTGITEKDLTEIKDSVKKNGTGAVISPNMSVGVNVFWKIIAEAAKMLPDYDIEIIEKHHRFKKDSPSGTAARTADIIAKAIDSDLGKNAVYGRKGLKERAKGEIGIHAVRAGDIVGEHTVLFGTLGERVEISHVAHSRGTFTKGVIKAAGYIKGKKGVYGMDDVLGI